MDDSTVAMNKSHYLHPQIVGAQKFDFSDTFSMAVLEKLSMGIIVLDFQGNVLYFNPEAVENLQTLSSGKKWVDIINAEIESSDLQLDTLFLKNKKAIRLRTQALEPYPAQLVCILDVTENIRLENNYLHQERLASIGKVSAKLAHQIRTPLSTALLYVKNMMDFQGKTDPEQSRRFLEKTYQSLNHIESQIRDMLLFAKGMSIVKKSTPLAELIHLLEEANDKKNIFFCYEKATQEVKIFCNVDLVVGAIQGCINNAIEAQKNQNPIKILFAKNNEFLEIRIHDQGEGIPENIKEKIVEAFFTTKEKGTGLGLSVADLVAKSHGGMLEILSETNKGTTVIFKLPVILE